MPASPGQFSRSTPASHPIQLPPRGKVFSSALMSSGLLIPLSPQGQLYCAAQEGCRTHFPKHCIIGSFLRAPTETVDSVLLFVFVTIVKTIVVVVVYFNLHNKGYWTQDL